jgi:FADH2 O2-dependent halogenase
MKRLTDSDFDVIVLGSGMAGSTASTLLARRGRRVIMLDANVHPRFAIGESTIPQTSQLIQLLAREHDVPELEVLGLRSPQGIRDEVTRSCGIKRVFGFAYHREGREHDPTEAHQFGNAWRDENHLFRQDIDSWLFTVAMKYGAEVRQSVQIESIDIDDDGVEVVTQDGQRFTAQFIIDGTGIRSVLAEKYDLREKPTTLRTSTRTLFTHMVGLKDFEAAAPSHMSHPWKVGTLHHLFRGGWFWVIPFNNWEGAVNPLVSVGLTLDTEVWPQDDSLSAEDEFEKFLQLFPSVGKQFEDARAVRPWVRAPRVQHSSIKTIGKRFSLLSHTAGFVDPLFSRGLISTMDNIRDLMGILLPALDDGDFSEDRFEILDVKQKAALSFADRMVSAGYASWGDFELWNLWVRFWAIGVHAAESNLGSVLTMGRFSSFVPVENPIFSSYEPAGYREMFEAGHAALMAYASGDKTVEETRSELQSILDRTDIPIPLRDRLEGQEWAMKNPLCRDIFLGVQENHERWSRGEVDAHLPAGVV